MCWSVTSSCRRWVVQNWQKAARISKTVGSNVHVGLYRGSGAEARTGVGGRDSAEQTVLDRNAGSEDSGTASEKRPDCDDGLRGWICCVNVQL